MRKAEELFTRLRANTVYQDACWLYQGNPSAKRPQVVYRGIRANVARAVLLALGVEMKSTDMACHHCDNPRCWNPEHIYKGSAQTNNNDTFRRGRNPVAKLTEEQVRSVLSLRGKIRQRTIASRFGISTQQVWWIWHGRSWKHVYREFHEGKGAQ